MKRARLAAFALVTTSCFESHWAEPRPDDEVDASTGSADGAAESDASVPVPSHYPYPFDCEAACDSDPPICSDGYYIGANSCEERCERIRDTNPEFCEREAVELLACMQMNQGACDYEFAPSGCDEEWYAFIVECDAHAYSFDCAAACAADPPICEDTPGGETCEITCNSFRGASIGACDREPLWLLECLQVTPGACEDRGGRQGCADEYSAFSSCYW